MAFGTTPVDGVEYALFKSTPARKVRGALWGGRVRYASYEANALAAGAQVNLFKLAPGEVVLGGWASWDALGATSSFVIGDAGDCDRYMPSRAGGTTGCAVTFFIDGMGYEVTSDTTDVIFTNSYNTTMTGTIKVLLSVGT